MAFPSIFPFNLHQSQEIRAKDMCKCSSCCRCLNHPPLFLRSATEQRFGAMDAIKDAGLRIPDDISVVGIDDVRESAYSTPPLTTFSVPKYDLGRTAVFILHDLISAKAIPPCRTVLLGKIVERQSAGAPRKKVGF